jgi:hypothetical protein
MSSTLRTLALLLLSLLTATRGAVASEPAQLNLQAACPPYYVGDTVSIDLKLDTGGQPIRFAGVFIKYDPTRLQFEPSYTNEPIFTDFVLTGYPWSYEYGYIAFTGGTTTPMQPGEFLAAKLDFKILSAGDTTIEVSREDPRATELTDGTFAPLPFETAPLTFRTAKIPPYQIGITPSRQSAFVGEQVTATIYNSGWVLDSRSPFPAGEEVFVSYDPTALQFVGGDLAESLDYFGGVTTDYLLYEGSEAPRIVAPGVIRTRVIFPDTTTPPPSLGKSGAKGAPCEQFTEPSLTVLPELAQLRFNTLRAGPTDLAVMGTYPHASKFFKQAEEVNQVEATLVGGSIYVDGPTANELRLSMPQRFVQSGQEIEFDVVLEAGIQGPFFVSAFIEFNPDQLEFIGGSINEAAFGNTLLNAPPTEVESGVLSLAAHSADPIVEPTPVKAATVRFRTLREGLADVQFIRTAPRATKGGGYAFVLDEFSGLAVVVIDVPLRLTDAFVDVVPSADSAIYVSTASPTSNVGDEIDFEIRVDSGPQAFGNGTSPVGRIATAFISYDPAKLEFVCGSVDRLTCGSGTEKAPGPPPPTDGWFTNAIVAPRIHSPGVIEVVAGAPNLDILSGILVATVRFRAIGEGFTTVTPLRETGLRSALETNSFRDIPVTTSEARARIYGTAPVVTNLAYREMIEGEAIFDLELSEPVLNVTAADFAIGGDLPYPHVVQVEGQEPMVASTSGATTLLPDSSTVVLLPLFGSGAISDANTSMTLNSSGPANLRIVLNAPSGTSIVLFDNTAAASCTFDETAIILDDEAARSVRLACEETTPGISMKPISPLNALDGQSLGGLWTLAVQNTGAAEIEIQSLALVIDRKPSAARVIHINPGAGTGSLSLSVIDRFSIFDEEGSPLGELPFGSNSIEVEGPPIPSGWLMR